MVKYFFVKTRVYKHKINKITTIAEQILSLAKSLTI